MHIWTLYRFAKSKKFTCLTSNMDYTSGRPICWAKGATPRAPRGEGPVYKLYSYYCTIIQYILKIIQYIKRAPICRSASSNHILIVYTMWGQTNPTSQVEFDYVDALSLRWLSQYIMKFMITRFLCLNRCTIFSLRNQYVWNQTRSM